LKRTPEIGFVSQKATGKNQSLLLIWKRLVLPENITSATITLVQSVGFGGFLQSKRAKPKRPFSFCKWGFQMAVFGFECCHASRNLFDIPPLTASRL